MQHVMIDLETLGTKPNALFPSIAAVQFDLITGEIGSTFYRRINIQDGIDKRLTIDAATLQWWMTQRPEIMKLMFEGEVWDLHHAMEDFYQWFATNELLYPWGNSASFDLKILENGLRVSHVHTPWKYSNERCYRTVLAMTPIELERSIGAHDPREDCKYQIQKLHMAYHKLNDRKESRGVKYNPD